MLNVTVGIITYQRPEMLDRLLGELAAQTFTLDPAPKVSILVVDNDAAGSARPVCDKARLAGQNVIYVSEPVKGIPNARNRVLTSLPDGTDVLVWINDNGSPAPTWLNQLLTMFQETEADIVMGATGALLPDGAPEWIRKGGFFSRRRFVDYATLAEGASNNCLISVRALRDSGLTYNETLRDLGGSDTVFFRAAADKKLRMVWNADALVQEHIPISRCNLRWLMRRHYRAGNTLALSDLKLDGIMGWLRRLNRGFQKLLQGVITLPLALAGFHELARSLLALSRGAGMFAGLMGIKVREN